MIKGEGERLFGPGSATTLELVDSTTFDTGAVVLTYSPIVQH